MTKKQKLFAKEYLIDLNGTQAAIRAGYSPDSAASIGSENLRKPEIRTYVEKAMAERSRRTGFNQDRVLEELAKVALLNLADAVDMATGKLKESATDVDTAALASVKVKIIPTAMGDGVEREFKAHDKLKAIEMLGKHMGMFTDKVQMSGDVGVQIIDDIGGDKAL